MKRMNFKIQNQDSETVYNFTDFSDESALNKLRAIQPLNDQYKLVEELENGERVVPIPAFTILPMFQSDGNKAEHEATDYPYGRLRTSAFFSVEHKPKYGFRHVFRTINPKNGRENKPKNGTYSQFCYNYQDNSNGHIEQGWLRFDGWQELNNAIQFISTHFDTLAMPEDVIKDVCATMFTHTRGLATYSNVPENKQQELLALIDNGVQQLLDGFKSGCNVFTSFTPFPVDKIKALEKDGENAVTLFWL